MQASTTSRPRRAPITALTAAVCALVAMSSGLCEAGDERTSNAVTSFEKHAVPLIDRYCKRCHGDTRARAELNLESYKTGDSVLKNRKAFEAALKMLRGRKMPPKKADQPSEKERARLIDTIVAELDKFDCSGDIDPGRPTLRRLNSTEYRNTIRDLVGVDFEPADNFPGDEIGYGFDNIGDVLSIPPLLFEKYFDAADEIIDRAFHKSAAETHEPQRFEAETVEAANVKNTPHTTFIGNWALGLYREAKITTKCDIPVTGEYLLRARAYGDQAGPDAPKMAFLIDGKQVGVVNVTAIVDKPEIYEVSTRVEAGTRSFGIAYLNNYNNQDSNDPKLRGDRNLIVDWIERGPAPSKATLKIDPRVYVVPPYDDDGRPQLGNIRKIVESFARRAYRRPLKDPEVDRLIGLGRQGYQQGDSLDESIQMMLKAILVSPHFLFRVELDPSPDDPNSVHPVGEFELATRLSYFLWSTMPDDELLSLADLGKLSEPEIIAGQVRRLLADSRSRAFVENFAGQWLQTRYLDGATPDPTKFPEYDETLRDAMREETYRFVEAIIREDRTLLELLDADFTFVNERLAKHYGLEGVKGDEFRRVSLTNSPRGGVLTQASVLTMTSFPTRTSPVLRGKWILERILGAPPPPPPPNAGELSEEPEAILSGSMRQRLEKHREDANCAVCHDKLDPLGFGFENFDAIGRWRDADGEFLVDASATLPNGQKFDGPSELKKLLIAQKGEFTRAFAEQVLTYALGRGLEYYDKCAVDHIVDRAANGGYKMSKLILAVVETDPFRTRRGGGATR
jgi:hypothetical protein